MTGMNTGAGLDTLFLIDDWHKGMYVTGLSGLYDYGGHNASWQSHKVYFLSPSKGVFSTSYLKYDGKKNMTVKNSLQQQQRI